MTTPVEKRNANKFCEFHGEVGHNTDECNHLRKQIEDMLKAGKLSHIIRELKQSSGKDQPKKKGETSGKEKPQAILMIQSRQKVIRQKINQSFSPNPEILFPSLRDDEGAEGPLIIEAEIGGHQVHRICIDGGSSFEILYEHCFNRLRPEIKNQMVPATTSLIGMDGFHGGKIDISTQRNHWKARVTKDTSSTINNARNDKISSHGRNTHANKVKEERVKVAINPEHPEQTVMIGSDLTEKARVKLCNLLQRSLDIFAWTPADMTGVPRHIAEHRLNVREGCQPVRQKKRGQAAERNIAINDRLEGRIPVRIPLQMLPGRIQWVSPNTNGRGG
ncbi:hypothetical protein Tco_0934478 [Tanacetum coccineum]